MEPDVDRLVSLWLDFVLRVRHGEGLDEDLFGEVLAALDACRVGWMGRDAIPRSAVNVMVDMQSALEGCAYRYEEPMRQRVIDASYAIGDDVRAAVRIEHDS